MSPQSGGNKQYRYLKSVNVEAFYNNVRTQLKTPSGRQCPGGIARFDGACTRSALLHRPLPLTSEETLQQAHAEGLVLRVSGNKPGATMPCASITPAMPSPIMRSCGAVARPCTWTHSFGLCHRIE